MSYVSDTFKENVKKRLSLPKRPSYSKAPSKLKGPKPMLKGLAVLNPRMGEYGK
jgi:hypothetical protein